MWVWCGSMSRKIDIVGLSFGSISVLDEPASNGNYRYVRCKCICGHCFDMFNVHARKYTNTECGCARRGKSGGKNHESLVGKRFGRLLVLRRDGIIGRDTAWMCLCDCGIEHRIRGAQLYGGYVESCGCLRTELSRVDMTGQRHGMLTAVRQTDRHLKSDRSVVWEFLCDCGKTKYASGNAVRRGMVASCGCARKNKVVVRTESCRKYFRDYGYNRRRVDVKFNLTARVNAAVRGALKRKGGVKIGKLEDILGYTMDQLHERLKRTMPKGHNWDDYLSGVLELEHIIPLAVFNFKSEADYDFKRAWALKNLRLLPSDENQSKGAKLTEPFQPSLI